LSKIGAFIPLLTGSKTPTSRFPVESKRKGGGSTARNGPIGELRFFLGF
jgi:hypothetical protein